MSDITSSMYLVPFGSFHYVYLAPFPFTNYSMAPLAPFDLLHLLRHRSAGCCAGRGLSKPPNQFLLLFLRELGSKEVIELVRFWFRPHWFHQLYPRIVVSRIREPDHTDAMSLCLGADLSYAVFKAWVGFVRDLKEYIRSCRGP